MEHLRRSGGIAALYLAAAYLFGIVLFLFVLDYPSIVEPAQKVALLVDHGSLLYVSNLVLYVVFGVLLLVLMLALYERLKSAAPSVMRLAVAIAVIWAAMLISSGMVYNAGIAPIVALHGEDPTQAAMNWMAIETVADGLGGAHGEILGGLLTLLVSWAALTGDGLPRPLNYLGFLVGAFGIVSTVPGLNDLAGLFGVSQLVWFIWLGSVMLRRHSDVAT